MKFRPCIDLHDGMVKQIVGSTLLDNCETSPETNFTADKPPAWFAQLYQKDNLTGGHVIKLGPGNDAAAKEALGTWPKGLQLGGGINIDNAGEWLAAGAAQAPACDKREAQSWRNIAAESFSHAHRDRLVG